MIHYTLSVWRGIGDYDNYAALPGQLDTPGEVLRRIRAGPQPDYWFSVTAWGPAEDYGEEYEPRVQDFDIIGQIGGDEFLHDPDAIFHTCH